MSQQKIALVTGGSSGMGKDFAKALLKAGMVVYTAARRIEKMDELKQLGAVPLKMDITKTKDIQMVVDSIIKKHGRIDVLINNAGFGMFGSVEESSIENARYQFEVNLFGLARLSQLIIPHMRAQKSGKIINISSMGGKMYSPLGAWYHATKHALEGWSDCLRLELASFGIDVVIIQPGAIDTEFSDVMVKPMLEVSGTGAYAWIANEIAKLSNAATAKGMRSEVGVITDLVMQAVHARKPRTRYVGGKYAKPVMFMRKWFSDRKFDKIVMGFGKRSGRK